MMGIIRMRMPMTDLAVRTGSWSNPSLTMMSTACSTVTVGCTLKGADSSRAETFSVAHQWASCSFSWGVQPRTCALAWRRASRMSQRT